MHFKKCARAVLVLGLLAVPYVLSGVLYAQAQQIQTPGVQFDLTPGVVTPGGDTQTGLGVSTEGSGNPATVGPVPAPATVSPFGTGSQNPITASPTTGGLGTGGTFPSPTSITNIQQLIDLVLNAMIQLAIPVLVLAFTYIGYLYVMARGDTSKVTKAHEALWYTIIGGGVLLGAKVIEVAIVGTITQLK